MKARNADLVSWLAILGALAASAAVYSRLPERMETHFAADGTPNGWMSRQLAAVFLPVLAAGVWTLSRFSYRFSFQRRENPAPVALTAAITTVMMVLVHAYLLGHALGAIDGDGGRRALLVAASLGIATLGLVTPKVRRNPFVGVRTFWTLVSEENWARTARFGGASLVVTGLLSAACALVLPSPTWLAASVSVIVLGSLLPVAYSVYVARVLARPQRP